MSISRPPLHTHISAHLTYRSDIDGLRALAILFVIVFHAFPSALRGGFVGVDVFFVISGFLISNIILGGLNQGAFSFSEFYMRRVRRIFPALAVVLLFCGTFGWLALTSEEYKQLSKHIAAGAGFVSNFVLWHESGYFDNDAQTKPLLHLWSLGIEEQFYLFWPLMLYAVWKNKFNQLSFILAVLIASFAFNIHTIHHDAIAAFYSPLTRFWELLAGGFLACFRLQENSLYLRINNWLDAMLARIIYATPRPDGTTLRNVQSILGLTFIIFAAFFVRKEFSFPGWWALFPTIGAFLLIAAGPDAWLNSKILSSRVLVSIGLISYPLYLWHWPLLSFIHIIQPTNPSCIQRLAVLAASFVLAALTYILIEKPFRKLSFSKEKALMLSLLMLAIGGFGAYVYGQNGLEDRAAIQEMQNNKKGMVYPAAMDDACKALIGNTAPLFPYCRYSDVGGKETIAFIGDSHAHVAFPGLAETLAVKHINLLMLANSSCPPFLGMVTGDNEDKRRECTARNNQIIQIVTNRSDVKTVIIASRGAVYLSNIEFVEGGTVYPQLLFPDNSEAPLNQPMNKLFATSLQRSVDALTKAGKTVYYLLEWPELAKEPSTCVKRLFRLGTQDCSVTVDRVLERQKDYRQATENIKDVTIIDPLPAFCPHGICQAFNDGKLLYIDNNHISLEGSRLLATKIFAPLFP